MKKIIKNIDHSLAIALSEEVQAQLGQIVSKTLAQNEHHSLTLFSFDAGEEISTHASDGDAMVLALEGQGTITIDGEEHELQAGQTIIMPAKRPHAVYAVTPFKMFLIVMFD